MTSSRLTSRVQQMLRDRHSYRMGRSQNHFNIPRDIQQPPSSIIPSQTGAHHQTQNSHPLNLNK